MMRRSVLLATILALLAATPAWAASTLTINGAGFGHGIGMSQYGAAGYAEHGW
jgi:stage II sporulation protein D